MRGFKLLRVRVILIVISVAISTFCRNGSEPLNYYGLTVLQDQSIGNKLGGRFKAKGQPVFLVHDPNLGLSQGDIMRFHLCLGLYGAT